MAGTEVTDSYGRRTVFQGSLLISDTTDTDDERKPQWLDIDIWRTQGGSYVVQKAVRYRVAHAIATCGRLGGYEIRDATEADTFHCPGCNPSGNLHSSWGQEPRIAVDVYSSPEQLIESLKVDGKLTRLSRVLLADLSEQDGRIDELWNTVVVD